jgi:hypothetical protein
MAEDYHRLRNTTLGERGTRSCKLETVVLLTGSDKGVASLENAKFWTQSGTISHSGQLISRVIFRLGGVTTCP